MTGLERAAGIGVICVAMSFVVSAQASECGAPGQPPCPLQAWMRVNVAAPLAANNFEALASGFSRAEKLAPDPAWASWSALAARGAEAARRKDIEGARAACRGCHEAWREKYRAKFRVRPIPR